MNCFVNMPSKTARASVYDARPEASWCNAAQQGKAQHAYGERDVLPIAALLALAMTGFAAILTETLPAGLLPRMAYGLGVSEALAGQSVTAYAVGTLIAAIPLPAWTQSQRRKPTLLAAIAGVLVFNRYVPRCGPRLARSLPGDVRNNDRADTPGAVECARLS